MTNAREEVAPEALVRALHDVTFTPPADGLDQAVHRLFSASLDVHRAMELIEDEAITATLAEVLGLLDEAVTAVRINALERRF